MHNSFGYREMFYHWNFYRKKIVLENSCGELDFGLHYTKNGQPTEARNFTIEK